MSIFTNYKGQTVDTFSYSSGQMFDFCQRKFYLQKKVGWRTKGDTAAAKFGVAVENAVQFFHQNGLKEGTGIDAAKLEWLKFKDQPLGYKKGETWEEFYQVGAELLALYEVMLPTLPIMNPEFQLRYSKQVFPGTEIADVKDQGFIDMISRAKWNHPLLPKIEYVAGATYRPVLVDIKTSGKGLDATPDLIQLDPQLAQYSWLSGIRDVGFLWFHRVKPKSFEKGTEITFIEEYGKWTAGMQAVVFSYDEETNTVIVCHHLNMDGVTKGLADIKGKGSTDAKKSLLEKWVEEDIVSRVPTEVITKQRLRFVCVRISEEDVKEAGEVVAQQIIAVREAERLNFWPKTGAGVRFPKNNCSWCDMRSLCLKNDQLRDTMLVQITGAVAEPEADWLDEID